MLYTVHCIGLYFNNFWSLWSVKYDYIYMFDYKTPKCTLTFNSMA